jgi:transcriptional regulator with XRE-family HTH domain
MSFKTEKIGEQIKKFRELRNFTQEHIAKQLDMTPQGYGKIERNEVELSIQKLATITEILGTTIQDILGFDEKFVFNSKEFKDQYNGVNYHNARTEEIKEIYESRITDLQQEVIYLRAMLEKVVVK